MPISASHFLAREMLRAREWATWGTNFFVDRRGGILCYDSRRYASYGGITNAPLRLSAKG